MKKRIINTAVAIATAMSLSVCAFAEAGPGVSGAPGVSGGPGASGEETITLPGFEALPGASIWVIGADVVEGEEVDLTVDNVSVRGDASLFDATHVYLGASLSTNVEADVKEAVESKATSDLGNFGKDVLDSLMKNLKLEDPDPDKWEVESVNTVLRVELFNQDLEAIQPNGKLTVVVPSDKKSNVVVYIDENGKVEWFALDNDGLFMTISTSHFSDYYYLTVTGADKEKEPPTTTSESLFPGPGNNNTPATTTAASEDNTTQAPEATTTKAPEATTTTKAPTGSDDKPNNGGNTTNADTNSPADDSGNSNVGNDGAGNGADKNQATGVVLAVIPAAIAAAAVVISKKRK